MRTNSPPYVAVASRQRPELPDINRVWQEAALYDSSLTPRARLLAGLAEKQVRPARYSRDSLFRRIAAGEPAVVSGFPVYRPPAGRAERALLDEIEAGFPRRKRARVRNAGPMQYLSIPEVTQRWQNAASVFGVTDLHYIGTHFDKQVDTVALNQFNLLPRGAEGFQSQDSLVISSKGAVTDSHSDDHSGSNHCFVGVKLWVLWDTSEGLANGLEDVERCIVHDRAAFDLGAFASLKSSRWLLITEGQTIFIPLNLSHKVITLEKYLGLGSFYASLPNFIDTLMRWKSLPPLWANQRGISRKCSVEYLTRVAVRRTIELTTAANAERIRWGVPHLSARLRQLRANSAKRERWHTLLKDPHFDQFVDVAGRL
jgi:hypothetical protein